ncbi:DUF2958 domain-containing protein [Kordiimonas aquimaris]|uniref:DUF2958 domain-containing protein n=1 Tax=Kordiimonas aquimaris TaxID=707591 RepID=UPI0021CE45E9|nr:DUF2958 domain-containing protein [Kordiimonas aquimaris]
MKLIPQELEARLIANWRKGERLDEDQANRAAHDPIPVVKFFDPTGPATWLVSEMVAHNRDILFGLCDLGLGMPELGYVSVSELESIRVAGGRLGIERDIHFTASYPISVYAHAARLHGAVIFDAPVLAQAHAALEREKRSKSGHR